MASGSNLQIVEHTSKLHLPPLSLTRLYGTNKTNVTRLNRKDDYYKNNYFNKNMYDGIELVALIERITKKQAAELLMKAGFSSYMARKLAEHLEKEHKAQEQNQKIKMTRFVMILRRYAIEHGMDISKII